MTCWRGGANRHQPAAADAGHPACSNHARFARCARAPAVNLARGAHVVEADLLAALESGHLQRAVLDVFQAEPLPAEHPFWSHPSVTVLPHVAALTDAQRGASRWRPTCRRCGRARAEHLVDRARGY